MRRKELEPNTQPAAHAGLYEVSLCVTTEKSRPGRSASMGPLDIRRINLSIGLRAGDNNQRCDMEENMEVARERVRTFLRLAGRQALLTNVRRKQMTLSMDYICPRCETDRPFLNHCLLPLRVFRLDEVGHSGPVSKIRAFSSLGTPILSKGGSKRDDIDSSNWK